MRPGAVSCAITPTGSAPASVMTAGASQFGGGRSAACVAAAAQMRAKRQARASSTGWPSWTVAGRKTSTPAGSSTVAGVSAMRSRQVPLPNGNTSVKAGFAAQARTLMTASQPAMPRLRQAMSTPATGSRPSGSALAAHGSSTVMASSAGTPAVRASPMSRPVGRVMRAGRLMSFGGRVRPAVG